MKKDENICKLLKGSYDYNNCIASVATKAQDESICENINKEDYLSTYNNCLNRISSVW